MEMPAVTFAQSGSGCASFLAEVLAVAMVSAEVTGAPAGVTEDGAKAQVPPDGSPAHAKETDCVKPFCGVTVSVNCADCPEEILAVDGEAARVKLAAGRLMV
jgi:hypothetical protein